MNNEPKALPKPKAPPLSRASIIRLERANAFLGCAVRRFQRHNDRLLRTLIVRGVVT